MAFDRLIKRIQETGNPSVAGLDLKAGLCAGIHP